MHQGWQAIAACRRHVHRLVRIHDSAGEESTQESVRQQLRERLVDGTLPRIDGRAWAGKGLGVNRCVCCGAVIATGAAEFEPRDQTGLCAHARCYVTWLAESRRLAPGP